LKHSLAYSIDKLHTGRWMVEVFDYVLRNKRVFSKKTFSIRNWFFSKRGYDNNDAERTENDDDDEKILNNGCLIRLKQRKRWQKEQLFLLN